MKWWWTGRSLPCWPWPWIMTARKKARKGQRIGVFSNSTATWFRKTIIYFTIKKDKVQPSVSSFTDRIRQKKVDLVNKTCCCVKLTNVQMMPPIIVVIFWCVLIHFLHWTIWNSNKDMITTVNCIRKYDDMISLKFRRWTCTMLCVKMNLRSIWFQITL